MNKKNLRMFFNRCAADLEYVADTRILHDGEVEEIGMCLVDNYLITYAEKEDEIHFYDENNDLLLSIDSTSPLLFMFNELINMVNEDENF